jgi:colanic acid/amylovoran biosynthesis glycosyltransferase
MLSLGWLPDHHRLATASLMVLVPALRARILHVHHGYRFGEVEGTARRLHVPLVVSFHGQDLAVTQRTAHAGVYGKVLRHTDAVIVPSRFLANLAIESGVPEEKIHVIPSGIDLQWFRPTPLPEHADEVLFVGRFVEKKGLDVLLKAWPDVRNRVPGARLRLLGFGPFESVARAGGVGVTVELADPKRRAEQVREAIRSASVVVTPSRTAADGDVESLLVVNLEAQASGRPLVTTRHGGIPEFVKEGETALVVPEADAEALADALVRVLLDRDLAMSMAAAGPAWALRFNVDACTEQIDRLYDSIVRS